MASPHFFIDKIRGNEKDERRDGGNANLTQ